MQILGIRIDNFDKKEILKKIEFFLVENSFHQIATVNPEFILQAQDDVEFRNILNETALNVADGIGIRYAFLRNFSWLKARIAGVDLMLEILQLANQKGLKVFLAINKDGLSKFEEIKKTLLEKYPDLKIDGSEFEKEHFSSHEMQSDVLQSECEILFCNFGAPAQEKFINSQKNGTIKLAMGVGGSFDFLTGKISRAPKILRLLGLEWAYRFSQQPKQRASRIYNATVVFAWKVLLKR